MNKHQKLVAIKKGNFDLLADLFKDEYDELKEGLVDQDNEKVLKQMQGKCKLLREYIKLTDKTTSK